MTVPDTRELVEQVRRGFGAGDRLVPGTMSEEEYEAGKALSALAARVEEAERECKDWESRRDWQYDKAVGWRNRCVAAEARVEELTEALRLASRLLDGEGYFDDPPDGARSVRDEVDAESSRGGGQP